MKSIKATGLIAATAAAVLLLAGCEKESNNTVENGPVAARITSTIDGMTSPGSTDGTPATRASGTAWAPNDAIGITATHADGTKRLDNACYVTPNGDGRFEAEDGSVLYFTDNAEVGFTAYYPRTAPENLQKDGITLLAYTDAQTPESHPDFDFLFATATGSGANADVRLQFRHCMSRLVLNFKPGEGIAALDDIGYTLEGIALHGRFNTLTGDAKADRDRPLSMLMLTVPGNGAAELSSPLILLPQQDDTQKTLTVTMRGTEYTATFQLPENPDGTRGLLAGYSYTYNVKINNTTMTISQATISDWSNGGSQDIESTN